jgi:hypothetical protein
VKCDRYEHVFCLAKFLVHVRGTISGTISRRDITGTVLQTYDRDDNITHQQIFGSEASELLQNTDNSDETFNFREECHN